MTSRIVQEIKRKVSLLDLVQRDVQLARQGRNYRGHCPHPNHPDSTPSFVVGRNKNGELVASCFGCGQLNMDVINYVQWLRGWSFQEAVKRLAEAAGIQKAQVPVHDLFTDIVTLAREQLRQAPEAMEYLTDVRKLAPAVIEQAKIGYVADGYKMVKALLKKGYTWDQLQQVGFVTGDKYRCRFVYRVLIPLWRHGEIRAIAGRQVSGQGNFVRYLYSSTEVPGVYSLPMAHRRRSLVLVEGIMDLLSARTMGIDSVAAITSAAYARHTDVDSLVSQFARVYYLGHEDEAGQRALETLMQRHPDKIVPVRLPVGYKDLNEVLQDGKDIEWLRDLFRAARAQTDLKTA